MQPELMPFQMGRIASMVGFESTGTISSGLPQNYADAKSVFPIFGGTAPEAPAASTTGSESPPDHAANGNEATPSHSEPPSGGDSTPSPEGLSPEQVGDLLKQVGDLTNKLSVLQQENNTFKAKEQQAERAKQTREQQLETDLTEAQQVIAKMDAVIKHTAIINAIQGAKDLEFHSARHVMNELDMESFELDVDLDSGTATVTGIENELKRIAKEMPWLVSKDKAASPDPTRQPRNPRGSGTPPAPPGGSNDKQTKRAALINKYPVIAHGRAI